MIQEGFFSNVGATPYNGLRRAFAKQINESEYFKSEPSLKKHVPGAQVRINDKNILTLYSNVYPDIQYEFDLTDVFNEIIKGINDEPDIDINKIDWDNFGVTYCGFNTASWSYGSTPLIRIMLGVSKNKMRLKVIPPTGYGGRVYVYLYQIYGGNASKQNFDYKFNKKFEYELDIVQSAVAICMNLRTSLTKYIKGLSDGAMKAIDVKKDIENYIKDLK